MKKKTRNILLGLVILSLVFLGGILTSSLLKQKPKEKTTPPFENNVLGDTTQQLITTAPGLMDNVNNLIQNSLQNTKEVISQKVIEAEKTILNTINKEVSTMTEKQVENLKWQICRDLGVVTGQKE